MAMQEELKVLPFGSVWDEYLKVNNLNAGLSYLDEIKEYENKVLKERSV